MPTGARRSPTRAVVRGAPQQGGNSGSARRTRRLTYSGARRQDHDTRRSAPGSSLPRYGHADSTGFVSNVETAWQLPEMAAFTRRLASFCRLIVFDKRGTGMSDRGSQIFTLEQRMHDVQ